MTNDDNTIIDYDFKITLCHYDVSELIRGFLEDNGIYYGTAVKTAKYNADVILSEQWGMKYVNFVREGNSLADQAENMYGIYEILDTQLALVAKMNDYQYEIDLDEILEKLRNEGRVEASHSS